MHKKYFLVFSAMLVGSAALMFNVNHSHSARGSRITVLQSAQVVDTNLVTSGQMDYLPGSVRDAKGLRILPANFTMSEQDGSADYPNPPINLYGTHYEGVSNFTLTADMQELDGPATIHLYSNAPILADEFRMDKPNATFTLDGSKLTVTLSDGKKNILQKDFTVTPSDKAQLVIVRDGKEIRFRIGESYVGTVAESSIFKSGKLWFGASASTTEWLLAGLQMQSLRGSTMRAVDASTQTFTSISTQTPLQELVNKKRPGLTVGAAMALGPLTSDSQFGAAALGGNFGSMTTENALKMQFVHPQPGIYSFNEADAMVAIANKNNMKVHAHTLVFGEALPAWVRKLPTNTAADKQKVEQVMLDHIATVAGHYKGKVASWDVVNEPLSDYDENNMFRQHIWYKAMGESYIAKAFHAARTTDPNAQLFINEFGLEANGERWDEFLALVTKLKKQGVPIDGVGFQSHVYAKEDAINPNELREHIKQLAAIGLKVRISEHDVINDEGAAFQQAEYANTFKVALAEPNVVAYSNWILADRYNYFKDDDGTIEQGGDGLFDTKLQSTAIKWLLDAAK